MIDDYCWWHPSNHMDRRPLLIVRSKIKNVLRNWFLERDFLEVDPSCLQIFPGNEAHIHALSTEIVSPNLSRSKHYLHTSPELAMKKLLAAGERKIFYLGPCFRDKEQGALNATEFTMLEWYRAEEGYEKLMDDTVELVRLACTVSGQRLVSWRGQTSNPFNTFENLSVSEAFSRHAGIDLSKTLPLDNDDPDRNSLAYQAENAGITVRSSDTWSDLFTRILTALIEPKLGISQPTILNYYPVAESALARPTAMDPRFAERFEVYCCGVELANGFGELQNPEQQRKNFQKNIVLKKERYEETYPIDEEFLEALRYMPEASGCALGFDRLVMLAAGATHINQVLWTPFRYD